jgi:hypothetical protein
MKSPVLGVLALFFTFTAAAQYGYRDANYIGFIGGITQTALNTNNFNAVQELGWNVGLSVRGNFYNDFDMVYAMQFSENKFSATTISPTLGRQDVTYKIDGVQIYLTPSYKIVEDCLSIEAGPVLQVNGKLKYDKKFADNVIEETNITVKGLENVSTFNILGAVGITAGVRNVRANVQYLFGFNNFLSGVKDDVTKETFKGHLGILSGNLVIYF